MSCGKLASAPWEGLAHLRPHNCRKLFAWISSKQIFMARNQWPSTCTMSPNWPKACTNGAAVVPFSLSIWIRKWFIEDNCKSDKYNFPPNLPLTANAEGSPWAELTEAPRILSYCSSFDKIVTQKAVSVSGDVHFLIEELGMHKWKYWCKIMTSFLAMFNNFLVY